MSVTSGRNKRGCGDIPIQGHICRIGTDNEFVQDRQLPVCSERMISLESHNPFYSSPSFSICCTLFIQLLRSYRQNMLPVDRLWINHQLWNPRQLLHYTVICRPFLSDAKHLWSRGSVPSAVSHGGDGTCQSTITCNLFQRLLLKVDIKPVTHIKQFTLSLST